MLQLRSTSNSPLIVCSIDLQPDTMDGAEELVAPGAALAADLPPAIAALRRMTRLTALALAIGTHDRAWWDDGEAADVRLPPLAGLSALTKLKLRLYALPPPDWQRLASLRRLKLHAPFEWGTQSLTGLSCLTHLSLFRDALPQATCLASLPRLASVKTYAASAEWREQLSALLPHVQFVGDA